MRVLHPTIFVIIGRGPYVLCEVENTKMLQFCQGDGQFDNTTKYVLGSLDQIASLYIKPFRYFLETTCSVLLGNSADASYSVYY